MSNTGQPPEKPTVKIETPPDWAIDLKREVVGARADIGLVANDLSLVKDRVTILETERGKQSGGIRQLSSSNEDQAAQLAQERAAREALAKEVADIKTETAKQTFMLSTISTTMTTLAKNPIVGKLLYAAAAAALAWLAKGHL
jgi:hypothetical protein